MSTPKPLSDEARALMVDLHNWHDFEDLYLFVQDTTIKQVPPPKKRLRAYDAFRAAFGERESKAHGYLKWFAWNRAAGGGRYESSIIFGGAYIPPRYAGSWLPTARVETDGYEFEPEDFLGSWLTLRCDVSAIGETFECGQVGIRNIVLPLAYRAVERVFWVPYPDGLNIHDEWRFTSAPLKAFVIRRCTKEKFERVLTPADRAKFLGSEDVKPGALIEARAEAFLELRGELARPGPRRVRVLKDKIVVTYTERPPRSST